VSKPTNIPKNNNILYIRKGKADFFRIESFSHKQLYFSIQPLRSNALHAYQPEAIAFYASADYQHRATFGDYADNPMSVKSGLSRRDPIFKPHPIFRPDIPTP